ncbi:hypothetical protein [Stenotrophomonas maltophilia]|uniref:hypothetical protein n=1 Tax=Stenotrophomonas maltophilia TaxID=40324 RepID=UPI0015DDB229|nr:hypothetical protein [Stenotrophomonas maltophilia]
MNDFLKSIAQAASDALASQSGSGLGYAIKKDNEAKREAAKEAADALKFRNECRKQITDFFAGDCAILIDSNVWMNQGCEGALDSLFNDLVAPAKKRMVMAGEQLEEIDRRRKSATKGDDNPEKTMADARHAIRLIERQAIKGHLKVKEVLDREGSRDFDTYALKSLLTPALSRGAKVIVISDDSVFRTRVVSSLTDQNGKNCFLLNSDEMKNAFG